MSEYKEYIEEKEKLDAFWAAGYTITGVAENLSGMHVEMTSPSDVKEVVLLTTADARKYVATKMFYS